MPGVFLGALLLLAALGGAACDRTTRLAESTRPVEAGVTSEPNFAQFSDVPVPAGADMDLERSLVLGEQNAWIGRLVMAVGTNPGKTFDFYFGEMPRFGWLPVTTVRAETSVLTFARGSRIATIQVWGRTLSGSTVSMTVSPKGQIPDTEKTATRRYGNFGSVTNSPLR
ncbi:MAG: hypothetical protein O3C49_10435 [Proteobacteria bacterium]|nr:hypothetical protein [Pseudomonadota bacterium]